MATDSDMSKVSRLSAKVSVLSCSLNYSYSCWNRDPLKSCAWWRRRDKGKSARRWTERHVVQNDEVIPTPNEAIRRKLNSFSETGGGTAESRWWIKHIHAFLSAFVQQDLVSLLHVHNQSLPQQLGLRRFHQDFLLSFLHLHTVAHSPSLRHCSSSRLQCLKACSYSFHSSVHLLFCSELHILTWSPNDAKWAVWYQSSGHMSSI